MYERIFNSRPHASPSLTNGARTLPRVRSDAPRISHAAALVPDVDASIRFLHDVLGWGPWSVYKLVPPRLDRRMFRGTTGAFGMIGAETHVGDIDFALNQSLTGPSIYTEYLHRRGYGLHHLACMSANGSRALVERFAAAGLGIVMSGRIDESIEFMYFDSEPSLGVAIEAGSGHAISLQPDRKHDVPSSAGVPGVFTDIAIVVRDLEVSTDAYTRLLGWGPWDDRTDEFDDVLLAGERVALDRQVARTLVGSVEVQLVQPGSGPSLERETLDTVGEGLHHIGCRLDGAQRGRIDDVLKAYKVSRPLTGWENGDEFWYVQSVPRLKLRFGA